MSLQADNFTYSLANAQFMCSFSQFRRTFPISFMNELLWQLNWSLFTTYIDFGRSSFDKFWNGCCSMLTVPTSEWEDFFHQLPLSDSLCLGDFLCVEEAGLSMGGQSLLNGQGRGLQAQNLLPNWEQVLGLFLETFLQWYH